MILFELISIVVIIFGLWLIFRGCCSLAGLDIDYKVHKSMTNWYKTEHSIDYNIGTFEDFKENFDNTHWIYRSYAHGLFKYDNPKLPLPTSQVFANIFLFNNTCLLMKSKDFKKAMKYTNEYILKHYAQE